MSTVDVDGLLEAIAAGARERGAAHPVAELQRLRRSGLGAARVPTEHGGAGWTIRRLFGFVVGLATVDPDLAHSLRSHFWFVEQRLADRDQLRRERWLDEIVAGAIVGNAITELGGGTAIGANLYRTTLVAEGDEFRLDGDKYYCTGALLADRVGVLATMADGRTATAVVPTDREGVELVDDWDGFGQRFTGSGTTRLRGVRVAESELIPDAWTGDDPPPTYEFAYVQLWLQAVQAGILRAVQRDAIELVRTRTRTYSHGSADTAAEDPVLQLVIGEIAAAAFTAESLVLRAAELLDDAATSAAWSADGRPEPDVAQRASLAAAQVKVQIDELAPRAATRLFDVGGASATATGKALDRHWRNLRTLASHNPTPYKARAIGDALVNDRPLPANGFF